MKSFKLNYFLHLSLALVLCATLVGQTRAAPTAIFIDGATSVTLDASLTAALETLGVTVGVSDPGTIDDDGVTSFPIVAGGIDLATSIGDISHSGGLSLSSADGTIVVDLFSFIINNSSGNNDGIVLTGLAALNDDLAGRFPLFNMDLTSALVDIVDTDVTITGVVLTLTATGAAALNTAFAVTAFTPDFIIGTADVAGIIQAADDTTTDTPTDDTTETPSADDTGV